MCEHGCRRRDTGHAGKMEVAKGEGATAWEDMSRPLAIKASAPLRAVRGFILARWTV